MALLPSRRNLVLSAATAAAVFGLDGSLAIARTRRHRRTSHAAESPHQHTPDPTRGYARYKVGDAEVTALYDGIWEKTHDPAYFSNATVDETKHALAVAGLTTAFVTIPITTFVIKLNGKTVLCDAGGGDQVQAFNPNSVFVSGKTLANMKAYGVRLSVERSSRKPGRFLYADPDEQPGMLALEAEYDGRYDTVKLPAFRTWALVWLPDAGAR